VALPRSHQHERGEHQKTNPHGLDADPLLRRIRCLSRFRAPETESQKKAGAENKHVQPTTFVKGRTVGGSKTGGVAPCCPCAASSSFSESTSCKTHTRYCFPSSSSHSLEGVGCWLFSEQRDPFDLFGGLDKRKTCVCDRVAGDSPLGFQKGLGDACERHSK